MNQEVVLAVELLQQQSRERFYLSPYWTERFDRALDILLRHPDKRGNPKHLVRNALSDAAKVLHRRQQIIPTHDLRYSAGEGIDIAEIAYDGSTSNEVFRLTFCDWIERSHLSQQDKLTALKLIGGYDAKKFALDQGVSLSRARVTISRLRKRIKQLWEVDSNV